MDASLPALPVFVALLLGFAHTTRATQGGYCQGTCPEYTLISQNQTGNYEERLYDPSLWICCKMADGSMSAAKDAHFCLQTYTSGKHITDNTWPVLLSVQEEEFSLCWMLTASVTVLDQDAVTVMPIPQTTFYVRSFEERQSIDDGKKNADDLRTDLKAAGEDPKQNSFCGAGYNSVLALFPHNEIWIPKADS